METPATLSLLPWAPLVVVTFWKRRATWAFLKSPSLVKVRELKRSKNDWATRLALLIDDLLEASVKRTAVDSPSLRPVPFWVPPWHMMPVSRAQKVKLPNGE